MQGPEHGGLNRRFEIRSDAWHGRGHNRRNGDGTLPVAGGSQQKRHGQGRREQDFHRVDRVHRVNILAQGGPWGPVHFTTPVDGLIIVGAVWCRWTY